MGEVTGAWGGVSAQPAGLAAPVSPVPGSRGEWAVATSVLLTFVPAPAGEGLAGDGCTPQPRGPIRFWAGDVAEWTRKVATQSSQMGQVIGPLCELHYDRGRKPR